MSSSAIVPSDRVVLSLMHFIQVADIGYAFYLGTICLLGNTILQFVCFYQQPHHKLGAADHSVDSLAISAK